MAEHAAREPVEWAVATRCRRGETTSGDLAVVTLLPEGVLVAGIDGLGHGDEAARAARRAAEVLRQSPSRDLVLLVERCHAALKGTRGAAISLAFVSPSDRGVTWLGVGNVEGRVLSGDPSAMRPKGSLPLGNGVPGHELPPVRAATLELRTGDILVLATDGVAAVFADSLDVSGSAQAISERILAEHGGRRTTPSWWPSATWACGHEPRRRTGAVSRRLRVRSARLPAGTERGLPARRVRAGARGGQPRPQRARAGRRPPAGADVGARGRLGRSGGAGHRPSGR